MRILRKWTREEDNFLKKNYKKMKYKEIGKIIGRSNCSVKARTRTVLGLKKQEAQKIFLSKSELEELYIKNGKNCHATARVLNVTGGAVLYLLEKYGIERRKPIKINFICKYCKKELIFPYKFRNRIYCSWKCSAKGKDYANSLVGKWMKDKNGNTFKRWKRNMIKGIKRKNIIPMERFVPNEDFAYCLGAYHGDGWSSKINRNYSVSLASVDKDFIDYYKACFEKWSGLKLLEYTRNYSYGKGKIYYTSKGCNELKYFVNFNLKKLYDASFAIKCAFLKGFSDAEGHMSFRMNQYVREIIISNTDLKLIKLCKNLLKDLGIESKYYTKYVKGEKRICNGRTFVANGNCHGLHISRKENLGKFNDFIGFSIARKQEKLKMAVDSYSKNYNYHDNIKKNISN